MERKMTRFVFALVALLSLDLSATSLRPISILVQIGGMQSEFPKAHHDSVRKLVAQELENGNVQFFREESFFNNSVEICVQAEGYALGRLSSEFSKLPKLDNGFRHSLSSIPCIMIDNSGPVTPR